MADEIAKIRNGETSAANVNAVVNASGKILSSVKLEIEYNKLVGKAPMIPFIPTKESKKLPDLTAKK